MVMWLTVNITKIINNIHAVRLTASCGLLRQPAHRRTIRFSEALHQSCSTMTIQTRALWRAHNNIITIWPFSFVMTFPLLINNRNAGNSEYIERINWKWKDWTRFRLHIRAAWRRGWTKMFREREEEREEGKMHTDLFGAWMALSLCLLLIITQQTMRSQTMLALLGERR